ncbi:DotU family type IV/VI secretion system protein [Caballeronia sordidicola]|uniref:DotU family type IV/VI secretion system protein n=1 Tax=Caballeronia sordidicola TaxID=196367 RepID=UPI0004D007AF|nr:DotU/TssL family secretion system protein [Caballeronia sordidicola]
MNDETVHTPLLPNAFRDTALTVASLADEATALSFATFRDKCLAQVEALRRELASAGHLPDVIRDATYAQCALLDEAALLRLKGADRDAWEKEPLQIREFQTNDAGNELIGLIRRRLAEPRPRLALLNLFSAVLGLGFKGQFAINGADARLELMRALDQQIGQAAPKDTSGTVLLTQGIVRQWSVLNARMSPLGWVVSGVVIAALVYLGLSQWLAASIARMAA